MHTLFQKHSFKNLLWSWLLFSSCAPLSEPLTYQVLKDENFSSIEARERFESMESWEQGIFNPGITPHIWWIKIPLTSNAPQIPHFFKLNNPHINFVEVYFNDEIAPHWVIGDNISFDQRPYWDRDLIIPLTTNEVPPTTLLLKIIKPGETLLIDPMLLDQASLLKKKSTEMLLIGLIIGWMGIMFMGACFFAWKLRDRSSILYAFFILSITCWLSIHWGLGFQYLWPENFSWNDKSRPVFNLLTNVLFLLLMVNFFPPLKKRSKLTYSIYGIIFLQVALIVDSVFRPMAIIPIENKMLFLRLTFSFSIFLTFLIITYLWKQYRAGVPYAIYYLFGISFMIGFNVLVQLHQSGISLGFNNFIFDFGSSIGMLGETLFITAAFVSRAADYKKSGEQLQLQLIENDKNIADRLINVQEDERNRLARDLHDSIGGMLASIYLKASQLDTHFQPSTVTQELKDLVSKSIVEARSISHNLTPPHLKETGLELALRSQLQLIQEQTQLPITFNYSISRNISQSLQLTLYRICSELVQNVLKHAHASELMIQLMEVDGVLELIVEDDGHGFDTWQAKAGIGLQNIQDRVSYCRGILTLDSTPSGTTVLIKIPLNYEHAT
ncbi:MAG: sensor histidine kinase [Mongoliitalea sp.]